MLQHEQGEWFHRLLEMAPDAIVVVNDDAKIVFANSRVETLFGYSPEELLEQPVEALVPEALRERHRIHRSEYSLEPGVRPMGAGLELTARRKDGSYFPVEISLGPLQMGEETLVVAIVRDVTEQRQKERELEELNKTLEERVQARTVMVRQLAKEVTLAEQRERRRIGQVLHDSVQQMLVAVKLNLNAVVEQADGETERKLQQLEDFVGEIIEVTRNLMVMLSAPAGRSEKLEDTLARLVEWMQEWYQLQVDLYVMGTYRIPDRDLHELVLHQVQELLFNVVKHAGVRYARLYVREVEEQLVIHVEDSGTGFDVAAIGKQAEGTGFGLANIRDRLALLGGRLELHSAPGVGSRATIILPKALYTATKSGQDGP
ncbi:MAG TPA: PAS domain S-box protein [Anaerolineae bacterium]